MALASNLVATVINDINGNKSLVDVVMFDGETTTSYGGLRSCE